MIAQQGGKLQFIAEAINSNNEELKMKNEKLWKGCGCPVDTSAVGRSTDRTGR